MPAALSALLAGRVSGAEGDGIGPDRALAHLREEAECRPPLSSLLAGRDSGIDKDGIGLDHALAHLH